ncbi:nitrogenase molybdenum-iron protein subunit beta [Desulfohalobiaceae bacterium Ax17]|uniref:nitrogenase molybdenum-iron protein subunit beta n=1 Tax=Desulfovulcanus ferrireducens TaxID=2831190 RepID=UPI00207BA768|nr:nitrogenase molybdenum-iron protein subunit beta [Desulfovulcanus ferrireducens]MBT8764534.1 nitrogenase molybdenum-iron protein subunit beta [Desulfovulcanus ferrireducens]
MLDHTPKEIVERQALRINPAKTCQPIGAMYAALGIHGCLPHSHGSQGCCSYHRSHLTRHYKEPVMASTSSFTEGASVFGGAPNLRQSLKTIFQVYNPDIVAVHTTCLSETIGDDIPSITKKAASDGIIPEGKLVIHTNTPSYVGSHITGFANMVSGIVKYLAEGGEKKENQVNVIPGFVEPSDMREIKRILRVMGIDGIVFPDTSDVLDTPMRGEYQMYPKGGVTIEDLKRTGTSKMTLALGAFASEPAAIALEQKCGVPFKTLEAPIGVKATDKFIQALMDATGKEIPESLMDERGRLVDIMTDYQHYLYGKKVALWGDPDLIVGLTDFLKSMGMRPKYIITGTPGKRFERQIAEVMKDADWEYVCKQNADLFYLHQLIKNDPVDLLIGNTYGKYISRAEDIPLVRFGFPILDRVGHTYFPKVGYSGGIYLISNIVNTLLDRADRDAPDERLELVM